MFSHSFYNNVSFILFYCNRGNVQNGFGWKKTLSLKLTKKIKDNLLGGFWIFNSMICSTVIP